jgi:bifunctional DNase/RNase
MSHNMLDKEVRVQGFGPADEGCVVVLEEIGGVRLLPIFTSLDDGEAMARQLAGYEPPRPLTHELIVDILGAFGWKATRVVISDVKDGTYHARIDFGRDGAERSVDARPSDGVNIALRAKCPIFVAERVFADGEAVLKPIAEDERKRFADELDKLDSTQFLEELAKAPATVAEPGDTTEGASPD